MSNKNKKHGPPGPPAVVPQQPVPRPQQAAPGPKPLLRDQRRALHAYRVVGEVPAEKQKDYKIAVSDLGANILRSGLAAALAAVERLNTPKDPRATLLLEHLAKADIPGLQNTASRDLPGRVRQLPLDDYILATREALRVAEWLKRAVQATFGDV